MMGAYLTLPVTEKYSNEKSNALLNSAASSMQGWRISQEDAHNLLLDFDERTSFFAVYDGHGGAEVALYCADKFPSYLQSTDAYRNGDIEQALKDAFLEFDASIAERNVIQVLKEISMRNEDFGKADVSSDEDVASLFHQAVMPFDKLVAKYKSGSSNDPSESSNIEENEQKSPFIRATKEKRNECSERDSIMIVGNINSSMSNASNAIIQTVSENSALPTLTQISCANDHCLIARKCDNSLGCLDVPPKPTADSSEQRDTTIYKNSSASLENNQMAEAHQDEECSSSAIDNGGLANNRPNKDKEKGKKPVVKITSKAKAQMLARDYVLRLLSTSGSESEDSDEQDETFNDSPDEAVDCEDEDDSNEEESDSCDEEYLDNDPQDEEFISSMKEEPGNDSGCTAIVAIVREGKLFVANAGDSRCILCRHGQAIDMSIDHKPEDPLELDRIVKAGGRVTNDGRVNGGLNLSRAIGDHAYKQNKDLPPEKQMISAMPDVKVIALTPQDEFLVLACDGIWNYMSSQETVDFIRSRIQNGSHLSHIVEQMFDHCLAPHTMGDGTGCDNMTAVIVQFKTCLTYKSPNVQRDPEIMRSPNLSEEHFNSLETNSKKQGEAKLSNKTSTVENILNFVETEHNHVKNGNPCGGKRTTSPEVNTIIKRAKVESSVFETSPEDLKILGFENSHCERESNGPNE